MKLIKQHTAKQHIVRKPGDVMRCWAKYYGSLYRLCVLLLLGTLAGGGCVTTQHSADRIDALVVAAINGNPRAQYRLAKHYQAGHGFSKDEQKAFLWYRRAAQQRLAMAQFQTAVMHQLGQGTPVNPKRALYWYDEAAQQGYAPAQAILRWHQQQAVMTKGQSQSNSSQGKSDEPLATEALQWYQQAASGGDADAQFGLGVMYEMGQGVARNEEKSQQWYTLAAAQGHSQANLKRGEGDALQIKSRLSSPIPISP